MTTYDVTVDTRTGERTVRPANADRPTALDDRRTPGHLRPTQPDDRRPAEPAR